MKLLFLPTEYSQQRQHEKKRLIWPVRLAMEATYHRNQGHTVWWDKPEKIKEAQKLIRRERSYPSSTTFSALPRPDRILTDAFNPKYQGNGNYKRHPGTYIQSADGCWWGACKFCIEKNHFPYQVRPVEDVIAEIHECSQLGFKEVFDDSATFPVGEWLDKFCKVMTTGHFPHGKPTLGCNMRMVDIDYRMMKAAGFRMVLFGLESANQDTLDKVNKGVKVEDYKYIIEAAQAGLEPHVCVIFGYPWETDKDAVNTLRLVHWLLRKGYAKTAQASFYDVPEGGKEEHRKYVNRIYQAGFYPDFWFNKLRDIKNADDLKYLWRGIKEGVKCLKKS